MISYNKKYTKRLREIHLRLHLAQLIRTEPNRVKAQALWRYGRKAKNQRRFTKRQSQPRQSTCQRHKPSHVKQSTRMYVVDTFKDGRYIRGEDDHLHEYRIPLSDE